MVVIYLTMSWFYSFFVRFFLHFVFVCILYFGYAALAIICIEFIYLFFDSISYYYEFSKEQDYICSKPTDSGMHMCSNLPPYRIGPMICNGKCVCVCNNWWSNIKLQSIKGIHITASFPLDLCWICVLATTAEHIKIPLIHFISTFLCSNQFSFSLLDLFFSFSSMPVITSI